MLSKNIINEVKVFSVPYDLSEIEGDINITTITSASYEHSNEKLINEAFKLHSQGNIIEAEKYYKYFITNGFNDPRVFSKYGSILKDLGKEKEAEIFIRKAIKLKPDLA